MATTNKNNDDRSKTEQLMEAFEGDELEVIESLFDAYVHCKNAKEKQQLKAEYNTLAEKLNNQVNRKIWNKF